MKKITDKIILAIAIVLSLSVYSQEGANDPTFNPTDVGFGNGDGATDNVHTSVIQADGKIIIGGEFISYNGTVRPYIARLNADVSLDATFNPGMGANYYVYTSVIQADGKIIIGGLFTSYNGTARNYIARLNVDGSLDATFNPGTGGNSAVFTTALQTDGKIIIGGNFTSYNGTARNYIARLNSDGSLDVTFNPGTGANKVVYTTALQADGKIIIGGIFTSYNGTAINYIARLNSDGSLDTAFNPGTGADNGIYTSALQADGKLIIGGYFSSYNGAGRNSIARLNANGSLDATFNPGMGANNVAGVSVGVNTTTLQADGKIIIGGTFSSYNGTGRNNIARLNTNGSLDATFNPGTGTNKIVRTTILQADGKLIIGGYFSSYNGATRNHIAQLNADGSIDSTFNCGTGANVTIRIATLQADGKIIIGGEFTSYNGTVRNYIARLNSDGSLDATFNPGTGANNTVFTTALQTDGKLIIGGNFYIYNGTARNYIARLNADGSLDNTFNPGTGANSGVLTSVLQANGKIIIGGNFYIYNGTAINYIARLNSDGSLDATFNPGTGADNYVYTTALQADGKLIIGGYFNSYNGTAINYIARLNANGSLDATFNPGTGANNFVYTSTLQTDGKLIIGGYFTSYNGTARKYIARLNADGSLDNTFNPGTGLDGAVYTIVLQADGKLIIGGNFTSYNGTARKNIARLNADGSLDATFNPGTGTNGYVYTTALQANGKIIIGGIFTSYNGTGRNRIARIINTNVTGIQENNVSKMEQLLTVSPNPFNQQTTLSFNKELKNSTLKIIDVLGKEVRIINFSGQEVIIEKEELKPGIYFIRVVSENEMIANEKMIIQ